MIIISNLPEHGNALLSSSSHHGHSKNNRGCPVTRMPPMRSESGTPMMRMAPDRTDSDLSTLSSHSTGSTGSMFSTASDYSRSSSVQSSGGASVAGGGSFVHSYKKPVMPPRSQYLAMDCEMCGTLTGKSVAARVVLTDWKGRSVLDTYVKPSEPVTDYRTFVSGITEEHLKDAPSLESVRQQVAALLQDKILVGHGLENDLESLGMTHPWYMIRDTAHYEPFMKTVSPEVYARSPAGRKAEQEALLSLSSHNSNHSSTNASTSSSSSNGSKNLLPCKLKDLAKSKLNRDIQVCGQAHSPVEDAVAALDLYKSHRPRWEACVNSQMRESSRHGNNNTHHQQSHSPPPPPPIAIVGLPAHVMQQQLQHRQQQQHHQMMLLQQQQQQMMLMQQQQQQQQHFVKPRYYQPYQQQQAYHQQQQAYHHQQQQYQQQYHAQRQTIAAYP